jgi:hypothetical protein
VTDPFRQTDDDSHHVSQEHVRAAAAAKEKPVGFKHPEKCPGCNASLKPDGKSVVTSVACPHCGYDLEAMLPGSGAGHHEARTRR